MKILKRVLLGLGVVLLLLIGVAVFVALTFDPNEYKPELVKLVKERTGRTLTIAGPIELKFFPKIGAGVKGVSLSEPNSEKIFAKIDEAAVALALLPLLSKQVAVDQLLLDGLQADLHRRKDGSLNIDDLIKPQETAPKEEKREKDKAEPLSLDIGGIALKKTNLGWRDDTQGTQVRLADLNFTSGRIASDVPGNLEFNTRIEGAEPKLALKVEMKAGYRINFETQATAFTDLAFKLSGDAAAQRGLDVNLKADTLELDPVAKRINLSDLDLDAKSASGLQAKLEAPRLLLSPDKSEAKSINGTLKLAEGARKVDLKLLIAALEAKGKDLHFNNVALDLDFKQDGLSVAGKLNTPLLLNLDASTLQLPQLAGDFNVSGPNIPSKSVKLDLKGAMQANWAAEQFNTDLRAKLDDSNLQLKLGVKGFKHPDINVDLEADKLDVDRYRPKPVPGKGAPKEDAAKSNEEPIDLSALESLDAKGGVRIGALSVANLQAQDFSLRFDLRNGHLNVDPLKAKFYGGQLAGNFAVDAKRSEFVVKQNAAGVNIGPLLRDLADKDLLEGQGTVNLDVRTAGKTVTALKRGLDGKANLVLKDGMLKGVNLAGMLRKAKAALGSQSASEEIAQGGEKTDFSDMSASFNIKDGVAHNEDLLMRSPFLRVTGAGDIDIGHDRMDYTAKVAVVGTSTGQEGKELESLKGLIVPVKISGPLDKLKYKLDTKEMAKDAAKQEIQKRLGGKEGKSPLGDLFKKKK